MRGDSVLALLPLFLLLHFEAFERAAPDTSQGGFGLGLWITRQVVEALGGTIAATSVVGEGSTFTVTLPRVAPRHDRGCG